MITEVFVQNQFLSLGPIIKKMAMGMKGHSCQTLRLSPSQQKPQVLPPYPPRLFVGRMISGACENRKLEYQGGKKGLSKLKVKICSG
jgi:hypothetical protein